MNSSGTVAFRSGGAAPPSGVIASTDGSGAFTILTTDASDPFGGAPTGTPRHQPFNDLGQTVYTRNVMDPNTGDFWEIVVTDGTSPTVVADTLGILDFTASAPNPALNNNSEFAFRANVNDPNDPNFFPFDGIFSGADPVNDLVIATGAIIDGTDRVEFLSFNNRGLNDQGQIVFAADMYDTVGSLNFSAIYRADPIGTPGAGGPGTTSVPAPGAATGAMVIALGIIQRRRRC